MKKQNSGQIHYIRYPNTDNEIMKEDNYKREALDYHESGRPGKIEVIPSKPTSTQRDLSLLQCNDRRHRDFFLSQDMELLHRENMQGKGRAEYW